MKELQTIISVYLVTIGYSSDTCYKKLLDDNANTMVLASEDVAFFLAALTLESKLK